MLITKIMGVEEQDFIELEYQSLRGWLTAGTTNIPTQKSFGTQANLYSMWVTAILPTSQWQRS